MDYKSFISALAETLGTDHAEAERRAAAVTTALGECGEVLDSVSIPRFGTFETVKEDERTVTDLSTGHRLLLPPSISMRFNAGAALRNASTKKGGDK